MMTHLFLFFLFFLLTADPLSWHMYQIVSSSRDNMSLLLLLLLLFCVVVVVGVVDYLLISQCP